MHTIARTLETLRDTGNLRVIPGDSATDGAVDLTGNDYLGIAADKALLRDFLASTPPALLGGSSSASRLLAAAQRPYEALEQALSASYGRPALTFNSGYHANTGIIQALADKHTLFLADKLVHASIIDGLNLAAAKGATFMRWRHNDMRHLQALIEKHAAPFNRLVIIAETTYSMDGDHCDVDHLASLKDLHPNTLLYLDEAHSVGVKGPAGLGLAKASPSFDKVDIIVGTLGKALASVGAYAVIGRLMRDYLVNTCRSLIFSTALPPWSAMWTLTTWQRSLHDDAARRRLHDNAVILSQILDTQPSHIQPFVAGSAHRALQWSQTLREHGYKVLAIRTPTVPPGTERLRFSLSAATDPLKLRALARAISALRQP